MINVNEITSTLRGMPDQQLQQYAMMHKGDPYILSLAVSESNQRKQMRQAAQAQAGGMPQPKVADAAIAGMAPVTSGYGGRWQTEHSGNLRTELPEDQGIGRLPAPNMQRMADGGIAGYGDDADEGMGMAQGGAFDFAQRSEPVLRMSGGGMAGYVPGFKNGGTPDKQAFATQYKDLAEQVGKELGVDPGIIISQWGLETGWGKKQVGQFNLGNIKDVTGKGPTAYDKMEKSKSSYKTYESPEAFAADYTALIKRNFPKAIGAGSDVGAFTAGLQSGTKGAYATDPNYRKSMASTFNALSSAIPSAQAGETPKALAAAPADTSLAAQIPGQSYSAPAKKEPGGFLSSDWFEQKAEDLGLSRDVGRNVSNTLNAPTPLAPAVGSVKQQSGLVALGEKLGNKLGLLQGPAGRMSAAEIAALKNEQAGLRALENSQLAMKEAQSAGATLEEQEYLRKMMEANRAKQVPSAAEKISEASLLREGQDVATAQRLAQTGGQVQTAARTGSLADKAFPAGDAATAPVDPSKMPFKGIDSNEMERMQEANQAPITRENVVEAAKEATPAKERKGFTNDDLLTLGLSLLANKSPNFMTALGESGLAAVAGKKEREKTEREQTKSEAELGYMKARTKEAEATAALIERGGKEKKMELEAEKMIQNHMADWAKSMEGKMGALGAEGSLARQREEDRVRTAIYASLGLKNIMPSTPVSSGSGDFKLVGVR